MLQPARNRVIWQATTLHSLPYLPT